MVRIFPTVGNISGSNPLLEKKYVAYELKPGTYILELLNFEDRSNCHVFYIYFKPNTLSFEIKKGEALYIGDYILDPPEIEYNQSCNASHTGKETKITPKNIRLEGINLDAVKKFVSNNYKNLQAPVVHRLPSPRALY